MEKFIPVSYLNVEIKDGFWKNRIDINKAVTIYSVRDRFIDTGRFEAFKFNWKEGSDIPKPHIFWDSDVAKWMESVAYILGKEDVPELKENVIELIALMEKNQCSDGYFNISHTVVQPENRFKIRDNHELYCLGHFIEAAVAWKEATGCDRLIKIVDKYIDLVIRVFTVEKSADFITPGHEEIELALIKLYRLTKTRKYLELALFFINERGKTEEYVPDWCNSSYNQSHMPVRQQKEAFGHAVRACYLYSALADAAKETDDKELFDACKAIFDDIVKRKMYITGGIGSSRHGEAFTIAYDLPNDTAYAETCASIALMMFSDRMKDIELDSRYADTVEREIYNGIISGVSLDGKAFFYENPLEINLSDRTRHTSMSRTAQPLPITRRQEVFGCSCCPPNITRFFSSIGDKIFSTGENSVIIHQFIACEADFDGKKVKLETVYPVDGKVRINIKNATGEKLYIRIPGWCKKLAVSENYEKTGGYMKISVNSDDFDVYVNFEMTPAYYITSSAVRANVGKAAVMMGPVVYCMEEAYNKGTAHYSVRLNLKCIPSVKYDEAFCCNILNVKAYKVIQSEALYITPDEREEEETEITLIPYFGFANREESDMAVWLNT